MLDRELAGRDDTFGLVTDVKKNFVAVNLDDGPFDDVAIVEVLDRLVDSGEKILGRADVVDGYLRRGDGGTWHVWGCSGQVV
ncbi:polyribonucleotide nucleotidyltransferase [Mycobacteroides abscessus subsp. abscessus]|nr:polyribonucleotide nucleotidyltransferase [Mycobacteroides abscessus subsp. abscessus]